MFTLGPALRGGSGLTVAWNQAYISPLYWLVSGGGSLATQVGGVDYITIISTSGFSTGKKYFEVRVGAASGAFPNIGIYNSASGSGDGILFGQTADGWAVFASNGNKFHNGAGSAYGSGFTSGDIVMVAVDVGAGRIWFGKNGAWFASGDPAAGTNAAFTNVTGTVYAAICGFTTSVGISGEFAAAYDPPAGFVRW